MLKFIKSFFGKAPEQKVEEAPYKVEAPVCPKCGQNPCVCVPEVAPAPVVETKPEAPKAKKKPAAPKTPKAKKPATAKKPRGPKKPKAV